MADGRLELKASEPGMLGAEISRRIVGLHKEFAGKGPTKCRTYVEDDVVIVLMRGGFSQSEQTLFEHGNWIDVRTSRHALQDSLEGQFTAVIEQLTLRKVIAFMSASHQDPDLQAQLYLLEPGREPTEAPDLPG